ncbi:DUF6083 domain-containing protein [Streptomyces roseolus]
MTTDTTARTLPTADLPLIPAHCPSCGLPGDLRQTPSGATVLLEHNDVAAPLTAADVPVRYRWTPIGHFAAGQLPDDISPETACQVEHRIVCPATHSDVPLRSARLRERRRLNKDRQQCARDRHEEDDPCD